MLIINRKWIAEILIFALVVMMGFGIGIPQNSTITEAATDYGLNNPTIINEVVAEWDCIYFGNYFQGRYEPKSEPGNPVIGQEYMDSDGTKMMYKGWTERNEDGERVPHYAYFRKEPIKWRILSKEGNKALLIADQVLDCQPYHSENTDITWENSSLRKWLNEDFYNTAFNDSEQSVIDETSVRNGDNPIFGTEGGNDTKDKVYLPSVKEVADSAYGFSSNYIASVTREAKTTEFAQISGVGFLKSDVYTNNGFWWLRTPGCFSTGAAVTEPDGGVYYSGAEADADGYYGIRPMLHLELSSSLYDNAEKATVEEKVSTWDCITFGNYFQSLYIPENTPENPVDGQEYTDSNGTEMKYKEWKEWVSETEEVSYCAYFKKEPIKWRVLSTEGDDAYLISDQSLDVQPFHKEDGEDEDGYFWESTWAMSNLRKWLNRDFYDNAFDDDEQAAIPKVPVTNINDDNTLDIVCLLSLSEALEEKYGFSSFLEESSKSRQAKNTDYVNLILGNSKDDIYFDKSQWWLRSVTEDKLWITIVGGTGHVYEDGTFCDNDSVAVRPVLHLNLSSDTWSKAGTVSSKEAEESSERPQVSPKPQTSPRPQTSPTPQTSPNPVPIQTPPSDNMIKQDQPIQSNDSPIVKSDQSEIKKPGKVKTLNAKNSKSRSVKVTWKKVSNATGYQIYFAVNKKFKKKTVKNTSKTKITLKKLKKNKKYYFKVRAYVSKNGKKIYGKWSRIKSVKVR